MQEGPPSRSADRGPRRQPDPLRVLHVVQPPVGGAPHYVRLAAEVLLDCGHKVHIACPPDSVLAVHPPAGARVWTHAMARSVSPVGDARASWWLSRLCREVRPHVVHCHSSKAGLFSLLASLVGGPRPLFSPHAPRSMAYPPSSPLRRVAVAVERAIAARSLRVVAVSAEEADYLVRGGIAAPGKLRIVRTGIPLAPALPKLEPTGAPLVTFVGRFSYQKDPVLFVEVAAAIVSRGSVGARFLIVGGGELEPEVRDTIARHGLAQRMEVCGWVEDTRSLLRQSSLLLLTSRYEAMPYVVLEAMAEGVPVVSVRCQGLEGLLGREGRGLMAGSRDPREAAALADRVLAEDDTRRALAEGAWRYLQEFHSMEAFARSLQEAYHEAIAGPGALRP